jgi:UDP-glucose 4-epimerase
MQSNLTDRTVLVTGGAGFIGSHIVESLVGNNEVRVLDDFSSGTSINLPTDVEILEGDIRDDGILSKAMQDVDIVFHHAAMVSVEESITRPRACQEINVAGTLSILDHARIEDARVVVPSSAAIYGRSETVPIPETARKDPSSPYGISKLAADFHTRRFADLYDLPTVVLRYFNVYGPRQGGGAYSGVIDIFLEQAQSGGPITVDGDGTQTRDFVHVDDVVRANVLAAETDYTGEAFNIATGDAVSIRALAELVRDATGSDAEIVHEDERPGDIPESCGAIERAGRCLGYEPTVPLRDGLASLADSTSLK